MELVRTLGRLRLLLAGSLVVAGTVLATPAAPALAAAVQHVVVDSGTVSVSNLPATQAVSGTVTVGNWPQSQAVSVGNWPTTQGVSGSVTANVDSTDSGYLSNLGKLSSLSYSSGALNVHVANPQGSGIRTISLFTTDTVVSAGTTLVSAPVDTPDCRAIYVAQQYSSQLVATLAPLDPSGAYLGSGVGNQLFISQSATSDIALFLATGGSGSPQTSAPFQWPWLKVGFNNEGGADITLHWAAIYCVT